MSILREVGCQCCFTMHRVSRAPTPPITESRTLPFLFFFFSPIPFFIPSYFVLVIVIIIWGGLLYRGWLSDSERPSMAYGCVCVYVFYAQQ
jgi:hypothetical protein